MANLLQPWHLYRASHVLREGGLIAYPTEAVFGLGCLPEFQQSILDLLNLKQRSPSKGLILVAASVDQLMDYVCFEKLNDTSDVMASWPGPVTWLIPASASISELLRGDSDKIAVRVSAHPVVQALCSRVGPLISTSANPNGQDPARTHSEVKRYFPKSLDYIVPGALGSLLSPTEIRDATTGKTIRNATS